MFIFESVDPTYTLDLPPIQDAGSSPLGWHEAFLGVGIPASTTNTLGPET